MKNMKNFSNFIFAYFTRTKLYLWKSHWKSNLILIENLYENLIENLYENIMRISLRIVENLLRILFKIQMSDFLSFMTTPCLAKSRFTCLTYILYTKAPLTWVDLIDKESHFSKIAPECVHLIFKVTRIAGQNFVYVFHNCLFRFLGICSF